MKLKEKVLEILENNRGARISGAEIAQRLNVSRNAVWKAVEELRTDGIEISAVRNSGYAIAEEEDSLSVQGILAILGETKFDIHTEKVVTSTNTLLKELAQQGAPHGYVLASECQTAGKGRLGRSFYSPMGSGVYISIILRPKMNAQDALFITTSAAVATARAIDTCCKFANPPVSVKPEIKWVNDIYIDGRKVSGMLTEAAIDFESGGLEYAVLGIGVNISGTEADFPEDIRNKAGSIFGKNKQKNMRNRLTAEILRELERLPESYADGEILDEYRRRSMLTGMDAYAHFSDSVKPCHVLGVDDRLRLLVRFEDGSEQALSSGEVSVRF